MGRGASHEAYGIVSLQRHDLISLSIDIPFLLIDIIKNLFLTYDDLVGEFGQLRWLCFYFLSFV